MNRIEDLLRETLAAEPARGVDAATMTGRVRDGVRRRRAARVRAVTVATVAAVVVAIAVGAVRLREVPPDPAPSPTGLHGIDTTPWPDQARHLAVGGRTAYAVVVDRYGCGCSVLHRYRDGAWRQVHTFAAPDVLSIGAADDGRALWAVEDTGLVASADGGEHWTPVELPGRASPPASPPVVIVHGDAAWVSDGDLVWRVAAGGSRGVPVTVPVDRPDLLSVGDALVAVPAEGEGEAWVSTDDGADWTPLAGPCAPTASAGDHAYGLCSDTVFRWTPDGTTTAIGEAPEPGLTLLPLAEGRVALLGADSDGWVLADDGSLGETRGLPYAGLTDAVRIGKVTFQGTLEGVYRTTDGAHWEATDPKVPGAGLY
ncbi:hypothetical protein [Nocardioides nitrophenolicus]|uniref:hypothetical protein n=1 Tax=Nocardioides nitrophenolicus TaxID=60489 RepID=UPI00195C6025|nr:hypothetical protein [Nocardioides nitrophenolicus]MBM7520236.1 hypothetical protein [Nocardioides nitrophenolicus]